MVDRYTHKITSIYDENRGEIDVISAKAHGNDDPAKAVYSTTVRTFDYKDTGENGSHSIHYKDHDVIRYVLSDQRTEEQFNQAAEASSDSNLEMIDLVVGDDYCVNTDEDAEVFSKPRPCSVPFASNRIALGTQRDWRTWREERRRIPEHEMMKHALSHCQRFINYLTDDHGDGRQLRVTHTLHLRRELGFISACTSQGVPALGILWQTMSRPQKAVCVTCLRCPSSDSVLCTCDRLLSSGQRKKTNCEHISTCNEIGLVPRIRKLLDDYRTNGYFGSHVQPEMEAFPCVELERRSPQEVTERIRKILQSWDFWIVFDAEQKAFIPVLKTNGKPFQCQVCRSSTTRRGICANESSCREICPQSSQNQSLEEDDFGSDASDSSGEDCAIQERERRNDVVKYIKNNSKRCLLTCDSERHLTLEFFRHIEATDPGMCFVLDETGLASCPRCGELRSERNRYRPRQIRLFTLSHGAPLISAHDWRCLTCRKMVYFTGKYHGVFPVRRTSAYSVELLYVWLQIVCYQGQSMRLAYSITKLTGSADSTLERFWDYRAAIRIGERLRSRRRANEAFRAFLRCIDVGSPEVTSRLFSCDLCEVSLTESDKRELGLCNGEVEGLKRFKAVVIDGTAAGILGKLPAFQRKPRKIPVSRTLRRDHRMVSTLANKKAIKRLCSLAREKVRRILAGDNKTVQTNVAMFNLSPMTVTVMRNGRIKKRVLPYMQPGHIDIVRMYVDLETCFCPPGPSVRTPLDHQDQCQRRRETFRKRREPVEVGQLLRSCFEASLHTEGSDDEDNHCVLDGDSDEILTEEDHEDSSESEVEGERQERASRARPVWMASLRVPVFKTVGQLIEALLDLVEFMATDHAGAVYILPLSPSVEEVSFDGDDPCEAQFLGPRILARKTQVLAEPSFRIHDRLATSLCDFADCVEGDRSATETWPCSDCVSAIRDGIVVVSDVNPILTRFCHELLQSGEKIRQISRMMAKAVGNCLIRHIEIASNYFTKFDEEGSVASREYYESYGSVLLNGLREESDSESGDEGNSELDDAELTGVCFPGRERYRPDIVFETKESYHCSKKYSLSERHTPGLLTVQCVCERPKLIGFVVMTRAESTSLALSHANAFPYPASLGVL